ncbi:hypothetical protein BFJ68_g17620 [Fusarium oxysporum]|uniref:CENP-V/GFA domain-containing protein n=2 Tax=Fusarium oxysporum TaxID=5507 RepID=A0A420M8C3_FUSOX|nr:hypothetical protein BFJ65_g18533 [Fusarium oxysporum f. sp. cepae]RKK19248.1 hypothetical protein BFJ67_g17514 [Fusarium oxysporum f. sp. cepae]RKK21383.1 hypothetical protein BFJ66_g17607 [Fusarium oxysporum f. sp. cepae]RKK58280.1 hypothetical protein BFJ69_g17404 [Fusarium oxysporum]RKK81513.1 hypothetical protein BFJ68_g17620 [Fusarium oxysporum]
MVFTGQCACGNVKYVANVENGAKAICHCLVCQKRTASAFSVNLMIPKETFKITQGTTKSFAHTADSGKQYHNHFCGDCGCTLYGVPEAFPDLVSIKAGSLDDPLTNLGKMDAEAYVKRRRDYIVPFEGVNQVEGMIEP